MHVSLQRRRPAPFRRFRRACGDGVRGGSVHRAESLGRLVSSKTEQTGTQFGMRVGVQYIVTTPSQNGEFNCGDHVMLCDDGSLECREAAGWFEAEDLQEVTRGMEVVAQAQ